MIRDKRHHQEEADLINKVEKKEDFKKVMMSANLVKTALAFRLEKKWKRVDLARFLNEKEGVIADLENGRLIHDPKLAQKIRLKCKVVV